MAPIPASQAKYGGTLHEGKHLWNLPKRKKSGDQDGQGKKSGESGAGQSAGGHIYNITVHGDNANISNINGNNNNVYQGNTGLKTGKNSPARARGRGRQTRPVNTPNGPQGPGGGPVPSPGGGNPGIGPGGATPIGPGSGPGGGSGGGRRTYPVGPGKPRETWSAEQAGPPVRNGTPLAIEGPPDRGAGRGRDNTAPESDEPTPMGQPQAIRSTYEPAPERNWNWNGGGGPVARNVVGGVMGGTDQVPMRHPDQDDVDGLREGARNVANIVGEVYGTRFSPARFYSSKYARTPLKPPRGAVVSDKSSGKAKRGERRAAPVEDDAQQSSGPGPLVPEGNGTARKGRVSPSKKPVQADMPLPTARSASGAPFGLVPEGQPEDLGDVRKANRDSIRYASNPGNLDELEDHWRSTLGR